MLGDLHKLRQNVPFAPFTVHMADGRKFPVPTSDHFLIAGRRAIIVLDDNDSIDILATVLIGGIATDQSALPAGPIEE